jgi:hypothetical protein
VRPYEPDFTGPNSPRNPWDPGKHPEHYEYIQSIINHVDTQLVRPPKYSEETKLEVYRLRDEGLTLRQIAEKTGVSKSTACLYIQKHKKSMYATQKVHVKQPGTNKTVEAEYSINEIDVGKIKPKAPKKSEV